MRKIDVDVEDYKEKVDYIMSLPWTIENEVLLAIVNLYYAGHVMNLQK